MDEAKILELAQAVDFYALLDEYADKKGYELGGGDTCGEVEQCLSDIEARLLAFARLVAEAATMAERERMEEGYAFLVRRIEALEKYQADYARNQQRMPGPFGR